jgi:hypothetical protein
MCQGRHPRRNFARLSLAIKMSSYSGEKKKTAQAQRLRDSARSPNARQCAGRRRAQRAGLRLQTGADTRVRTTTRISIRITKRKCLWSSLRCKPDSSCIGNLYRRMELCVASSQRTIHRSFLAKQDSERFRKRAQSVSGQPATALR